MRTTVQETMAMEVTPFMVLVLTACMDGFWSAYAGVWFMTKWIPALDSATISGREVAGAILAIVCGIFVSKFRKGEVSLKELLVVAVIADLVTLIVFIDINIAAFCAILSGKVYFVYANAFWSKLVNTNIDTDKRVEFDSFSRTSECIGKCIGAIAAYFFPITLQLEYTYVLIILVMDMDFLLRLLFIKFNILKY